MLKATEDQRILLQVWRIPSKKISINTFKERQKEAPGVYAKEDCLIPAAQGNTSQYKGLSRLRGRFNLIQLFLD